MKEIFQGLIDKIKGKKHEPTNKLDSLRNDIKISIDKVFNAKHLSEYSVEDPQIDWPAFLPSVLVLCPKIAGKNLTEISITHPQGSSGLLLFNLSFGHLLNGQVRLYGFFNNDSGSMQINTRSTEGENSPNKYANGGYEAELLKFTIIREILQMVETYKRPQESDQA